jgi:ATPase subunit of ABC transporter with duplicated ATPase domains
MLHVINLSKSYEIDPVLSDLTFIVNQGERVGLVGPNGTGKTTLLRIIAGTEKADQGRVRFNPPELSVGYLAQALIFEEDETVAQALARATQEHSLAWQAMERLAAAMGQPENAARLGDLTDDYAQAESRFEATGGYQLEARLEAILDGLDLTTVPRDMPVSRLSGGQKTRLGLAGLLTRQPRLLLLDEPTNHLDIDALDWLESWLNSYDGAVLIVSHDRTFLDRTTNRTLVLDPETHTMRDYSGNYSAYVEARNREIEQQWQAYKDQQTEIGQLYHSVSHLRGLAVMRKGGKADDGDKFATGFFGNRSARSVGRAKQLEQRIDRLLTDDRIDKPGRQWGLKLDFAEDESGARQVLTIEDLTMAFGERVLFEDINVDLNQGERVALVGPNGEGKTTLLRIITGELRPLAGRVRLGKGVKPGYLSQEQEVLDLDSTPYDTIRTEAVAMNESDIRSFLHFFLFSGDEVFNRIGNLSFGERTRLMLARLVAQGCNFLVLDEPINHLDITSRERFEEALCQFPGTVLAVVHDRTFVERVATRIWVLRDGRLNVQLKSTL